MGNVRKWLCANKLSLNIGKTEYILIGSWYKTNSIDTERGIKIENQVIEKVRNTKVLGVKLDENLSWEKHIDHISSKITSGIGAIMRIKDYVEQSTLVTFTCTMLLRDNQLTNMLVLTMFLPSVTSILNIF